MATTETKTGFRLPWSSDHRAEDPSQSPTSVDGTEEPHGGERPTDEAPDATTVEPTSATADAEAMTPEVQPATDPTPAPEATQDPMPETTAATSTRRPTKFLADLTKAMLAAAEAERAEIVSRFQADAKAFTELIQERSGTESTNLRKQADDDIAAIREWSKAEIARIREETEQRISSRRTDLDEELDAHAARIEKEGERVKAVVDAYETEMTSFFEELAGEEDPTRFAALAASLPEPPSLEDALSALAKAPPPKVAVAATVTKEPEPAVEPDAAPLPEPTIVAEVEAASESPADTTPAADAVDAPEPTEPQSDPADPRLSALGLTPDFAAAEAEALAIGDDGSTDDGEAIPSFDEEALAARLAGLTTAPESGAEATTQLIVSGLVSVASIAGFKRHLARLAGVRTVGVSSGPDGEFLFNVVHDEGLSLGEAIPTLPGFAARVTGSGEGILNVAARDPETDA
jgi:hypothetical protein